MNLRAIWHVAVAVILLLGGAFAAVAAPQPKPLVDVAWLAQHLHDDNLVILDVRSEIDDGNKTPFSAGHIPGSVYSSYTQGGWRVEQDGIIGQLPPVADLEQRIGGLGIGNDDTVIIVPAGTGPTDFGSAARIYWTFKILGHDQVGILNGGYHAWVDAGNEVATGDAQPWPKEFTAHFRPQLLASTRQVEQDRKNEVQLVDARPAEFFDGKDKHPQARVAGTIPGALDIPNQRFFRQDSSGAWFFEPKLVSSVVGQSRLKTDEQAVTFCNTGHWAATDWFALTQILGMQKVSLYDGSMVAWTANENRPVQIPKHGLARILDFFSH